MCPLFFLSRLVFILGRPEKRKKKPFFGYCCVAYGRADSWRPGRKEGKKKGKTKKPCWNKGCWVLDYKAILAIHPMATVCLTTITREKNGKNLMNLRQISQFQSVMRSTILCPYGKGDSVPRLDKEQTQDSVNTRGAPD